MDYSDLLHSYFAVCTVSRKLRFVYGHHCRHLCECTHLLNSARTASMSGRRRPGPCVNFCSGYACGARFVHELPSVYRVIWLSRRLSMNRSRRPPVPIRVDLTTSGGRQRQPKCKQLSMGTWNVRSLGNKFSSVSETITDRHLDLLAVVESWHRDSGDVSIRRAAPAGFRYIDEPRNGGRGGGLVIYFREHFKAKRIDINIQVTSFEYVVISLTTPAEWTSHCCCHLPTGISCP